MDTYDKGNIYSINKCPINIYTDNFEIYINYCNNQNRQPYSMALTKYAAILLSTAGSIPVGSENRNQNKVQYQIDGNIGADGQVSQYIYPYLLSLFLSLCVYISSLYTYIRT